MGLLRVITIETEFLCVFCMGFLLGNDFYKLVSVEQGLMGLLR